MMNRIIPIVLALALAGCAGLNPFSPVKNPVSATNLYEAELVFDGTLKTFIELKGLCVNRALPSVCRTYVKTGQGYIVNAYAADKAARSFIAYNPTLDATNVVQAFTGIVSNFQATVNSLSATKS
jgi:hypothetical protein